MVQVYGEPISSSEDLDFIEARTIFFAPWHLCVRIKQALAKTPSRKGFLRIAHDDRTLNERTDGSSRRGGDYHQSRIGLYRSPNALLCAFAALRENKTGSRKDDKSQRIPTDSA